MDSVLDRRVGHPKLTYVFEAHQGELVSLCHCIEILAQRVEVRVATDWPHFVREVCSNRKDDDEWRVPGCIGDTQHALEAVGSRRAHLSRSDGTDALVKRYNLL